MSKRSRQYLLSSLVYGFLAVSTALLASAVFFALGGKAAPAAVFAAEETASAAPPSASGTAPGVVAQAAITVQPSPAASERATPTASMKLAATPAPATKTPASTETVAASLTPAAQTAAATAPPSATPQKMTGKAMTIQQLIAQMEDYTLDRFGSIGVVKRGDVAYYCWAQDLYLVAGGVTKRILGNADCSWMYLDEAGDLWFGIRGGIGIEQNNVQEWESAYRYDHKNNSFRLMRQENSKVRFPDGQGFLMLGPYYFYLDGKALMACHTVTGREIAIGSIGPGFDVRVSERYATVYYQNAKGEYFALANLGEPAQASNRLDMAKFPGGKFHCDPYLLDGAGQLYQFQGTGYRLLAKTGGLPDGVLGAEAPVAAGGTGFPGVDTVTLKYYDRAARAWVSAGDAAQEGTFSLSTDEERYWFVNWKPAGLFQIHNGKYSKYDLSGTMTSCTWAGLTGGIVFLAENTFYSNFSHAFLPEQNALYSITFPPLPGDKSDR